MATRKSTSSIGQFILVVLITIMCPLLVAGQESTPWSDDLSLNAPATIDLDSSASSLIEQSNDARYISDADQRELDRIEAARIEAARFAQSQTHPVNEMGPGDYGQSQNQERDFSDYLADQAEQLTSREGTDSSIRIALMLAALSLAPALILMTTSYVRVVVVLTLLRQAFGAQQLPPTQVITSLSLFLTLLVMAPVWNDIKSEAIDPYANSAGGIEWKQAWERGVVPVKKFMGRQILAGNNSDSIAMFYKYLPDQPTPSTPENIEDVPLSVLLPAFMISELKIAFLLGFQIYLPFLVVDLVVATVTVSMGMLMLPPTMVSFPLKLILFVMVDGWTLVVGMLLQSFGPLS